MRVFLAVLILVTLLTGSALAQMPGGAFERLSPGDQKIARALFDAQHRDAGSRLTLDQIAAKKGSKGWGVVFKDMNSHGLVSVKNLGQVVSHDRSASLRSQGDHTLRGIGGGSGSGIGGGPGHAGGR